MLAEYRNVLIATALSIGCLIPSSADAQDGSDRKPVNDPKANAYFANAADYQNAGAFELAAQEWEKLLREFPNESQASTAWHHLGICNIQRKQADYPRAIEAFRQALKDPGLPMREEALINLAWALYSQSRLGREDTGQNQAQLEEAKTRLVEFLKEFSDGPYTDQAIFTLGDIEYLLGNRRRAIEYFKRFLDNRKLSQSELRPEALYALAVAHEDERQVPEAQRRFQEFVELYPEHALTNEVRIRWAGLLSAADRAEEAAEQLRLVPISGDSPLADLALLRLGILDSQRGNTSQAIANFERLISGFPQSSHLHSASLALGNLQLQSGNLDRAAELFQSVTSEEGTIALDAAHGWAVTLMQQDKHSQAAKMLEGVLQRFQASSEVRGSERWRVLKLDQADACYALPERKGEAHRMYESLAAEKSECPTVPKANYMAALCALEVNQYAAAQQWSEKFLTRFPNHPLRTEVALVAAEALLQQGLHDGAVRAFRKLIESNAQDEGVPIWKLRLSLALYLDGKYEEAGQIAGLMIERLDDPERIAEAQFISGASSLYQERLSEAITALSKSYETDSQWTNADEVLLLLGEAYQRSERYPEARQTYARLLERHSLSRFRNQALYKLAQLAAAEKDWSAAIDQYRIVLDTPTASSFHNFSNYGVAWCFMQQKDYQPALAELQILIAKDLRDSIGSEALLAHGICLRNLGQPEAAIASLNQFLQRSPKGISLANALYELGLAQTELGQLTQANQAFNRLLEEVRDYPAMDKVLYEAGWNLYELNRFDDAAERFKRLAEQYPISELAAESLYMVAQNHYDQERFSSAVEVYRKILDKSAAPELLEKTHYKIGWSLFQTERYDQAGAAFDRQVNDFPNGPLSIDGLFMRAECDFKQERFEEALAGFRKARMALEESGQQESISPSIRTLIYLHGGQCLRELERWKECEEWLGVIIDKYASSPHLPTALYELGYCKQSQGVIEAAILHYSEVADNYRNEIAARARFMLGEIYFAKKDFIKAIPEFQRVMYGFGGEEAPEEIKKWQAKSAFEAARCSEVLLQSLNGPAKKKGVETTIQFYQFLLEKHAAHELAAQAQSRLGEIQKLR
jgi:cellulose synthase operon protein C